MAAVLRSESAPAATSATAPAAPAADRRQWWEAVQVGVSTMLTEAAHPAAAHRAAG